MMAESIDLDGDVISWYCSVCGRELGADLAQRDGVTPCPVHGFEDVAWETWLIETSPTYPHEELGA